MSVRGAFRTKARAVTGVNPVTSVLSPSAQAGRLMFSLAMLPRRFTPASLCLEHYANKSLSYFISVRHILVDWLRLRRFAHA